MRPTSNRFLQTALPAAALVLLFTVPASAQLTDKHQTPITAGEEIHKTLQEPAGTGRGDVLTPESSLHIIRRDTFQSIRRGRQIFQRKFIAEQGLGPRSPAGFLLRHARERRHS